MYWKHDYKVDVCVRLNTFFPIQYVSRCDSLIKVFFIRDSDRILQFKLKYVLIHSKQKLIQAQEMKKWVRKYVQLVYYCYFMDSSDF
jgi:hypothetical protein